MLQGPPEGVSPLEVSLIPVGAVTSVPLLLDVVGVVHSSIGTSMVARLLKRHALKQLDNVINCLKVWLLFDHTHLLTTPPDPSLDSGCVPLLPPNPIGPHKYNISRGDTVRGCGSHRPHPIEPTEGATRPLLSPSHCTSTEEDKPAMAATCQWRWISHQSSLPSPSPSLSIQ